jgi:hypothetical protein
LPVPTVAIAAGGSFADDDSSIFEADIEWLADAGVTRGCNPPTNDRFCPNSNVTRGQMAAFMRRFTRFLGATGVEAFGPDCGGSSEVCVWWEPVATPGVVAYIVYRGESGVVDGPLETVAVADLYLLDTRYEYIDYLPDHPPAAPNPYPLCYAVAAVDAVGVTGAQSTPACTSPDAGP